MPAPSSAINLRLSALLLERVDTLTTALAAKPALYPDLAERGAINRSTVLREAVVQGLAVMERKASQREGR